MVKILTRADLEDMQRVTGDKGIFARYRNIDCRFCRATVFVPSWPYGSAQASVYVPAAYEIMHEQDGCPACRPDLNWEMSVASGD